MTFYAYTYPWSTTYPAVTPRWDYGISGRSVRVTGPTDEPMSLAYVRDKVIRVVNGTEDDDFITLAMQAAREAVEDDKNVVLMPQTWQWIGSAFPTGYIQLPKAPLLAVQSIDYADSDGVTQTLSGSPAEFTIVPSGKYAPGRVVPFVGASWPSTRTQDDAVTVTYTAGYPTAADVPADYKWLISLLVVEMYKNRSLSMSAGLVKSVLDLAMFGKRRYP